MSALAGVAVTAWFTYAAISGAGFFAPLDALLAVVAACVTLVALKEAASC